MKHKDNKMTDELINHIMNGEHSKANGIVNNILQSKIDTALEQEKIAVAASIYNQDADEEGDAEELEALEQEVDLSDELEGIEPEIESDEPVAEVEDEPVAEVEDEPVAEVEDEPDTEE